MKILKHKHILLIFGFISCLFILTGCWGKKELDELALVSAIAIDESELGYLVSVQVMVPREIASDFSDELTTVKLFSDEGESLFQTIRKLTRDLPRKSYFTHLMAIIISENIAKDNMVEILDFFLRDPEVRPDVPIFIAKDTLAQDILNVLTHIEPIPASKIKKVGLNFQTNYYGVRDTTFLNLVTSIASAGVNPAIMGLTVYGNKNEGEKNVNIQEIEAKAAIKITDFAIFKNEKLIGWLNEDESRGYSYLIGEIKNTIITIPCDKNKTQNLEITSFKNKTKLKMENGKPIINITHQINSNIAQLGCSIDKNNYQKLEKLLEKEIIKDSQHTLNVIQKKFKSDVVGFGELIHRKKPVVWKKLNQNWDDYFVNLTVNLSAEIKINRPGVVDGDVIKKILK